VALGRMIRRFCQTRPGPNGEFLKKKGDTPLQQIWGSLKKRSSI
jgi:hypothetical protein